MTDADALKAEMKKLNNAALQAKMDLHDLSEELPTNWDKIPAVAQRAFDAFKALEEKRAAMKSLAAT